VPDPSTLAERVAQLRREKAARERRDISQKEVALEVGVSNPVISETESGKTYPSNATLVKLARYFGVSERFLEYGDGETKGTAAGTGTV
jgi:transcriptional regulator with XRE-family HTH domain